MTVMFFWEWTNFVVDHNQTGHLTGRLSNNTLVHFEGPDSLIGTMQNVRLTESKGFYYFGELAG